MVADLPEMETHAVCGPCEQRSGVTGASSPYWRVLIAPWHKIWQRPSRRGRRKVKVREPIRATGLTNREQIPWGKANCCAALGGQDEHMSLANAVAIVTVTRPGCPYRHTGMDRSQLCGRVPFGRTRRLSHAPLKEIRLVSAMARYSPTFESFARRM
jgi:hypothetical protein